MHPHPVFSSLYLISPHFSSPLLINRLLAQCLSSMTKYTNPSKSSNLCKAMHWSGLLSLPTNSTSPQHHQNLNDRSTIKLSSPTTSFSLAFAAATNLDFIYNTMHACTLAHSHTPNIQKEKSSLRSVTRTVKVKAKVMAKVIYTSSLLFLI